MFNSVFAIFLNTFFSFTLIPISSGTLYEFGIMFLGAKVAFPAKISAIFCAILVNYFVGFLFQKFVKKPKAEVTKLTFLLPIFTFLPLICGVVCFYCGAVRLKFWKFILISFFSSFVYYAIAIYFPTLNIYF